MQPIIQLIRVDNRLVHGQTGVTSSNSLDIDTIIVIDDETVQNIFSQKLMTSIAKAGSVHRNINRKRYAIAPTTFQ